MNETGHTSTQLAFFSLIHGSTMTYVMQGSPSTRIVQHTARSDCDLGHIRSASARYADRILAGANSAEMAIEQPTVFEFVVSVGIAQSLGFGSPLKCARCGRL